MFPLPHPLSLILSLSSSLRPSFSSPLPRLFLSRSPLALVFAAIKSQFYTGGYPKLIASTRGAPLEWTPRNYVSTAVRGLYEPYKNGTTQPRRRSRTTREKGGSWKSGPDDDSGISWRTSRVTHGDDRLKAISRSNRNRSFRGIPSSPSPRFFFCSISSFFFFIPRFSFLFYLAFDKILVHALCASQFMVYVWSG